MRCLSEAAAVRRLYYRQYRREQRKMMMEHGLCLSCKLPKELERVPKLKCAVCQKRESAAAKARFEKRDREWKERRARV